MDNTHPLLVPRYRVKIDAPIGYKKGDIIVLKLFASGNYWPPGSLYHPDEYPDVFEPLPWQYGRKESELPAYVKDDKGVYKVKEWHPELASDVTVFIDPKIHSGYSEDAEYCPLYSEILPATEADYLTYKSSTEGKGGEV